MSSSVWMRNVKIFGFGVIIMLLALMVYYGNQTASLTDVFSEQDILSGQADLSYITTSTGSQLSSNKDYKLSPESTLRVMLLTDVDPQELREAFESSYGFFIENNDTESILTLYLPDYLPARTHLFTLSGVSAVIDTVLLFHHDTVDQLRIDQQVLSNSGHIL